MYHDQEINGKNFGMLTAIRFDHVTAHRERLWLCKCECGNYVVVRLSKLISGEKKSCGCDKPKLMPKPKEPDRRFNPNSLKKNNPRIYRIWQAMKARCYRPSHKNYSIYGGRGIRICPEWIHNFSAFCSWAISHGYEGDLTIDRIDNYKGYSPNNCRWITMAEQQRNKRKKGNAALIDATINTAS